MQSCLRSVLTEDPKLEGLLQKLTLSQCWRSEVRAQGGGKAETRSLRLPASGGCRRFVALLGG